MADKRVARFPGAAAAYSGNAAGFAVDSDDDQLYLNVDGRRRLIPTGDVRVLTAAHTLTAVENGATIFFNAATGFAVTLPAPFAGARFRFYVATQPTNGGHTIVSAGSANIIVGTVHSSTGGDADSEASGGDTITFVASTAVKGDRVDVISDGTNWYATAFCDADGGVTITTAS